MKNLYIYGVLCCASLNISCGGRSLHKPVPISCDAGFNTNTSKIDKITLNKELTRTCEDVSGRFRHLIKKLRIGSAIEQGQHMKAEYQTGQIVFYDTSEAETTCRHELIHAACDIGGYSLQDKDQAFKLMKQLFLTKHLQDIRFEDYLKTIAEKSTDLLANMQDFRKQHPNYTISDVQTKVSKEHAMIMQIMQQFAGIISDGRFQNFADWKLLVFRFHDNIQRALDILENQKLLLRILDQKNSKLLAVETIQQMQQLLLDMRYRMLQCFNPEEILAHAFDSNTPNKIELALQNLLQRF